MEGNKMSIKEEDTRHRDGPSWTIVGRYGTFAEADIKRIELKADTDLQVKVHYYDARQPKGYIVKERLDPSKQIVKAPRRKKKKRK
tara:strand:- start:3418 stop:3675 length:258 start_codon:yes stop_codon:yes gene_type:complete